MPHQLIANRHRLVSIDLLRAVAAIAVFVFHVSLYAGFDKFILILSVPFSHTSIVVPNVFSLGAAGVSLFFVVSGYCLTLGWFRANASKISVWDYAIRRIARIYPAYAVAILVALAYWLLLAESRRNLLELFADFTAHALFLQGFFPQFFLSLNGVLWSMSTEVQFYLTLPAIYLFAMRRWPTATLLGAFAFSVSVRALVEASTILSAPIEGGVSYAVLISYSLLGRLFEFVAGMWIARSTVSKGPLGINLATTLLLLALAALVRWKGPGWMADPAWGIAFGGLLIWMLRRFEHRAQELCGSSRIVRAAQKFGIASYSFFLIHMPVLLAIQVVPFFVGMSDWARFLYLMAVGTIVTTLLAYWMQKHVEKFWQRRLLKLIRSSAA